jgi:hypothetical protein
MFEDAEGPIERFDWGRFTIAGTVHGEGHLGVGKDIRVIGTKVTEWAERKGHLLTPKMVTGIYHRSIEVLVIGNGVYGSLEVPPEVVEKIRRHGIADVRVAVTPEACGLYNQLYREGRAVALLAHGTC